MSHPSANDVKVFVPTRDLDVSVRFYQALGWQLDWRGDDLAQIALAGVRLFLQKYYAKEWAENFMISVNVDDARAWYDHARRVIEEEGFSGVARVMGEPRKEPWGALVTYVVDPCGVLIHFAQMLEAAGDS